MFVLRLRFIFLVWRTWNFLPVFSYLSFSDLFCKASCYSFPTPFCCGFCVWFWFVFKQKGPLLSTQLCSPVDSESLPFHLGLCCIISFSSQKSFFPLSQTSSPGGSLELIFWKFWSIFFVDFFPLSLQLSTSCQFLAWHCCCLQIFYFSLKLFHKVFLLQSENWNCKLFQPFAYLTQFLVFCALWAIRTSKLAYGLCTDLSFRNQKS